LVAAALIAASAFLALASDSAKASRRVAFSDFSCKAFFFAAATSAAAFSAATAALASSAAFSAAIFFYLAAA